MPPNARRFAPYTLVVVAAGWLVYGFGISPAYYSWGRFLPQVLEDLDLTRAQGGLVFGLFTLCYQSVSPVAGWAIGRTGVRTVMVTGSIVAALGFLLLSRADSLAECILYYAVLGGAGVGFSTILPTQTLASNWFRRYRATVLGVMMTAGGIVGRFVPTFDAWALEHHDWRTGWLVIAGVSATVALVAALFVRGAPEDVGLLPDGMYRPDRSPDTTGGGDKDTAAKPSFASELSANAAQKPLAPEPDWAATDALRTPQFLMLVLAGVAYAAPWGAVVSHGVLHLSDRGLSANAAGAIIGWMVLVSIAGRLSGFLGDVVAPQRLLGLAILVEVVGLLGVLAAPSRSVALASALLLGLGFGVAYVSSSATFADFFGRRAFALTAGTRMLITGLFNASVPAIAGWVFDRFATYAPAFLGIAAIGIVAGCIALASQRPGPLPTPAAEARG